MFYLQILGGKDKYMKLLARQLLFMTSIEYSAVEIHDFLHRNIDRALKRLEYCLSWSNMKHNKNFADEIVFNPLHSGHCAIFLYFLSKEAGKEGGTWSHMLAYLNKMMNGLELSPFVDMPNYFFLEHPLGTILGRAKYGDGFFCMQGGTVGAKNGREPLEFPEFGRNVLMMAHSACLGNAHIGNNVIFSFGSMIMNENVPDNSIIFGRSPNAKIVTIAPEKMKKKIAIYWREKS